MLDEEKPVTAGELKLSDLPPIEDLAITVPKETLIKVGKVVSVVEVLVVIETIQSMPPLDLDTVLFDHEGNPIGQIFDVFGSVKEPHYSIRFTNAEQIKDKGIHKEMAVFFAAQPDRSVTKFAFVNELKKNKGTDASWEHDNEPPESVTYYSDDEDEKFASKRHSKTNRKRAPDPNMTAESDNELVDN